MDWIDFGYELVWDKRPPSPREIRNSKSSKDNHEFVTKAVDKMVEAGAVLALPSSVLPTVISPLEVVPKPNSGKLRLVVNMEYDNEHIAKRVFKLEGLSYLSDKAEKGDWNVAYDLTSGYYHVSLHLDSRRFVGFNWRGIYYRYNCLPFGFSTSPWVFSKVTRELVM
jgi:hypothetical protein